MARRYRPLLQPSEAAVEALRRRYARWAAERRLVMTPENEHRFAGRMRAHDVVFATGLGGSRPSPPEIVVFVDLDVPVPLLLRRDASTEDSAVLDALRDVLEVGDEVRNLGVTASFVRITFEPGAEAELLELALDALDERLRLVAAHAAVPYRS
jgi:hypothetical protein